MGGAPTAQGQVYYVPWKVLSPGGSFAKGDGLTLYWFPVSREDAMGSKLRTSRTLTLLASQCVTMAVVTSDNDAVRKRFSVAGAPLAVLAGPDDAEVGRLEAEKGTLSVSGVEKLVRGTLNEKQDAVSALLDQAGEKAKSGDRDGAVKLYRDVMAQRCLFPGLSNKAAKALEKLGEKVDSGALAAPPRTPTFDDPTAGLVTTALEEGLAAENRADFELARRSYQRAHDADPADPVPLRYQGELYRHHTGEWDLAEQAFRAILAMPADPCSRAVALHGLGKMTIHEGRFAEGLALFDQSIATFPTALCYRNLSVYWNSEGDLVKARGYVEEALALDPDDPYNLVFAATSMIADGRAGEAMRITRDHEDLLPASYNLAAVYAQAGDSKRALALLERHFYQFEQYDAVRRREMKEAREDAVFASLKQDARFLMLTSLAAAPVH
ncbi:MAG: tetratricopeptide repeat protein [Acidobacteriota bacterium]